MKTYFDFIRNYYQAIFIIVLLFVISYPFTLLGLGDILVYFNNDLDLKELYTFNQPFKDFITVWLAFWGLSGAAFGIIQMNARITKMDDQNQIQLKQQEAQQRRWEEQDRREKNLREEQLQKDKEQRDVQFSQFTEQIQKQDEQIKLQEKQQRDARFASGVELIGSNSESARIGGVYSLFFLAREYPTEYLEYVCQILCSHVQTITWRKEYQSEYADKPSNEIQTLIVILLDKLFFNCNKNLSKSYLKHIDFRNSHISAFIFTEADLTFSNFSLSTVYPNNFFYKTVLDNSIFFETQMQNSYFVSSSFKETQMNNTNFSDANLNDTNFADAVLSFVNFSSTKLSGATFFKSYLVGANFFSADLSDTIIHQCNLTGAKFQKAELFRTDLTESDITNAQFKRAKFIDIKGFSEKELLNIKKTTALPGSALQYYFIKRKSEPKYPLINIVHFDQELVRIEIAEPIPRNHIMADYLGGEKIFFTERTANAIQNCNIKGVEIIPTKWVKKQKNLQNKYFCINISNEIEEVKIEELKTIPLKERLVCILEEYPKQVFFHRSIAQVILKEKPTGLQFLPIENLEK